jgi:hypothetical protein
MHSADSFVLLAQVERFWWNISERGANVERSY